MSNENENYRPQDYEAPAPYRSADEIDVPDPVPVDMPVPEPPRNLPESQQPDPAAETARQYAEAQLRAEQERYAQEERARQERENQEYQRRERERLAAKRRAENKARLEAEMRARELAAAQEPVEIDPQATADPEKHYYKLTVIAEDGKEREPLYFDNYSDYKEALEAANATNYIAHGYEVTKEEYEQAVYGKTPESVEREDKSFKDKMDLVERGRRGDLNELMRDDDWRIRMAVADKGYGLNELSQDIDPRVRAAVVRQGYNLDRALDTDPNELVQRELLLQGYRLDTLMESSNPKIRAGVAEQGYGHEKLVQDEDWRVRSTVARYGSEEHLEILKRDADPRVRAAVAERNYGLDELHKDPDTRVRLAAANNLYRDKKLDIEDRARLASDPKWQVRYVVASNGVHTDKLKNDPSPAVAAAAVKAKPKAKQVSTGVPGSNVNAAIAAAQQRMKQSPPKVKKAKTLTYNPNNK